MRCLFCDKQIERYSPASLFLQEDALCPGCRAALCRHHQFIEVNGLKIETFYEYDGMFRSLLLQYKECYDEALKDVFLYGISDYLRFRYHDYQLLFVPSTKKKQNSAVLII